MHPRSCIRIWRRWQATRTASTSACTPALRRRCTRSKSAPPATTSSAITRRSGRASMASRRSTSSFAIRSSRSVRGRDMSTAISHHVARRSLDLLPRLAAALPLCMAFLLLAPPANARNRDVSGHYERNAENDQASLDVTMLPDDRVKVDGVALWNIKNEKYGPNLGELNFEAPLKDDAVTWH